MSLYPVHSETLLILPKHCQIVKERQMEFDVETDPDTMYELFGEDYVSFAE